MRYIIKNLIGRGVKLSDILELLKQFADGIARQFGPDCEVVIHDLKKHDMNHSIVYIVNGNVTNRQIGGAPSKVVLETFKNKDAASLKDHVGYLTRAFSGKVLKSSTFYIHNEDRTAVDYIFSINYDITGLLTVDRSVKSLIDSEPLIGKKQPEKIVNNVTDLLDSLIEQSVALVGKPAALMNKEEKVTAIRFLNDAGAFLITKSGDKISKYFGISKFTLYSYVDIKGSK